VPAPAAAGETGTCELWFDKATFSGGKVSFYDATLPRLDPTLPGHLVVEDATISGMLVRTNGETENPSDQHRPFQPYPT
jgi:hypothetical protein